MPDLADRLDHAITAMLAGQPRPFANQNPDLDQLSEIASDLRFLPRADFRARLRADLVKQASLPAANRRTSNAALIATARTRLGRSTRECLMPPRFITPASTFPVRGSHLAVSFALHVAALAFVVSSGLWIFENGATVRKQVAAVLPSTELYLAPSRTEAHGGGGGGDRDKVNASRGSAPRFAVEQLTPPTVAARNEAPILPAEPTLVGPPEVKLPQLGQTGDPTSAILNPPSNGTGSRGGIGSGSAAGIGSGEGPGVGEGRGGGIGGGVFYVGGGVLAPRPIYAPDPEYSEEARKAKFQGSVVLSAIIGPDGLPRNLRVRRSLGLGLDQKALEAVARWRFEPALKDGHPVAVEINIEVLFRLY
jgi:periplasmic protein TonB